MNIQQIREWLLSRGTKPRFSILIILSLCGFFLWYLFNHAISCALLVEMGDKIPTFHILVLSLPTAIGLWIFRNNDKKTDHQNAKTSQEQFIQSLKKEDIFKVIQIQIEEIETYLQTEIEIHNAHSSSSTRAVKTFTIKQILSGELNPDFSKIKTGGNETLEDHYQYRGISMAVMRFGQTLMDYVDITGNYYLAEFYKKKHQWFVNALLTSEFPQKIKEFYEIN